VYVDTFFLSSGIPGALDTRASRQSIVSGNMLLLQVQALLISALAGSFAFVLSWISKKFESGNESKSRTLTRRAILRLRDGLQGADDGSGKGKGGRGKGGRIRKKPVGNPGFSEYVSFI
jgi:hypothetical protein